MKIARSKIWILCVKIQTFYFLNASFGAKIQISDWASFHQQSNFWTQIGLLPQCEAKYECLNNKLCVIQVCQFSVCGKKWAAFEIIEVEVRASSYLLLDSTKIFKYVKNIFSHIFSNISNILHIFLHIFDNIKMIYFCCIKYIFILSLTFYFIFCLFFR